MKEFTPYDKLSKKQKRESDKKRRGCWGAISPVTRVSANKKLYNRKRTDKRDYTAEVGSFYILFSATGMAGASPALLFVARREPSPRPTVYFAEGAEPPPYRFMAGGFTRRGKRPHSR